MRIDEVAVLVGRADAVGVAVCAEAGVAAYMPTVASPVRECCGSIGSGLMPGNSGSGLPRICTWSTPMRVKMSERIVPSRAVHGVDAELHARLCDQVEIGEALDGLEVGRQEIDFGNRRGLRGVRRSGLPRYDSIAAIIDGLPEPPYQPLYLTPFHCAGLCDEVIMMPPAAPRSRTPKLSAGVGVMALCEHDGNAGGGDNFGAGAGEMPSSPKRVS